MADLTLRLQKGSPVTFAEMDSNLLALDSDSPWKVSAGHITYDGEVGIGPGVDSTYVPTYHLDFGVGDSNQQTLIGSFADTQWHQDNATDFAIWTDTTERFIISGTSGNIGIGISVPNQPLDVAGNIQSTATVIGDQGFFTSVYDGFMTISGGSIFNGVNADMSGTVTFGQLSDATNTMTAFEIDELSGSAVILPASSAIKFSLDSEAAVLNNAIDSDHAWANQYIQNVDSDAKARDDSDHAWAVNYFSGIDSALDSEHAWNVDNHTDIRNRLDSEHAWNVAMHDSDRQEMFRKVDSDHTWARDNFDSDHAWNVVEHSRLDSRIDSLEGRLGGTDLQNVTDVGNVTTNDIKVGNLVSTGIRDSAASSTIRISATNDVGVGTPTPLHALHLTAADQDGIQLTSTADVGYLGMSGQDLIFGAQNDILFQTASGTLPNGTTRMTVDDNGLVGIGQAPATHMLEINAATNGGPEGILVTAAGRPLAQGGEAGLEITGVDTLGQVHRLNLDGSSTQTGTATANAFTDGTATLTGGSITGGINGTFSGTLTGGTLTDGTASLNAGSLTGGVNGNFSGTITGGTLTDGTASLNAGSLTGGVNGNFSGTLTGGTLTDGTASLNAGSLTGGVAATFSGAITGGSFTDGTATLTGGALTGMTSLSSSGAITGGSFVKSGGLATEFLMADGTVTTAASISASQVANSVTFNNGGSGAASGTTFNGSAAVTVSYNTVGAPSTTGTGASGSWGINITGNSATTTALATARNIGGVSFDGTANINLPGVNTAGNQDTSGNAATATSLGTSRNINGTAFDGSADITTANWGTARNLTLGGTTKSVNGSANYSWTTAELGITKANIDALNIAASTAATLATARTIGGVSFDGSANINLPGVNQAGNQNTTGSAGSVVNAVTFNNGGSGAASGTTFNGSAARTVSYNTVGAPSTTGAGASGSWGISITGNAATASTATTANGLSAAATVTEAEGIGANDNDTTYPTSAAVKDYVDANTGGGGGTVTSVTAGAGMTQSGTNTINPTLDVVSANGGITVNANNIQLNADQRGHITQFGQDNNDYISVGTANIDFVLDGSVDMRLFNSGELHSEGDMVAFSNSIASDQKFKKDVYTIENALDKVNQLRGVHYTWKPDTKKAGQREIGLIAQEVQDVIPEVIKEVPTLKNEGETHLTVDYSKLVGLLIEAVKDLSKKVKDLEST